MKREGISRISSYFVLCTLHVSLTLGASAQTPMNLRNVWGKIDSEARPWAQNVSRPNEIGKGLKGRHISVWASHGRYYSQDRGFWKWQRPELFCTTEDLFTQTIVVPYLIPMLENAGAYVFTPRERDWQTQEIIVDNDLSWPDGHITVDEAASGMDVVEGFGMHGGTYADGENPFTAGSALTFKAVKPQKGSAVTYVPNITVPGRYAVYVSYPYMEDAVDDVRYIVCHKGVPTEFRVNQQVGYGTWVYLGTFEFGATATGDRSGANCVILSTGSNRKGRIGADAVRFGGGMGNIQRNGTVSGMARCLEGARYYCQWAGAPYSVYSDKQGENDYGDDINARSLMTNWLGGGSAFMPSVEGRGVPIELSLAIHSDAGYEDDGGIHGSLAIATTDFNDGLLASGVTRQTSLDLASQLLDNLCNDMSKTFGTWNKRYLWDRNYSETRLPEVPSAIIETLAHQSFHDMVVGQHPYGKFTIARSLYKTVLRYICEQHGKDCVVQPLAPRNFRLRLAENGKVVLEWSATIDPQEPTANPTSYNIYTAIGSQDFDNGQNVKSTVAAVRLTPGVQYSFRVTACNDGGESFPTEVLSAYIAPDPETALLVVSGFQRLAAPYIVDTETQQGFDLTRDEGVQRGMYPGWCGRQLVFEKSRIGIIDESGLGYSGTEMQGRFIAGNDFDYTRDHVRAIASAGKYSVVSCSLDAFVEQLVDLHHYALVDLAFGLQKDDGQLGLHFKTFSSSVRRQLDSFTNAGGALLVSGSFLGSDMLTAEEQQFMRRLFKLRYIPTDAAPLSETINGLGMKFDFHRTLNDIHYAATHPEVLSPIDGGICAMQYSDGTSAAVGYKGRYSCFAMGFPFECIKQENTKDRIMQGLLAYLLGN